MSLDLFGEPRALRPLHPHQDTALEALRRSLGSGRRRPMLQAPTGFGKTLTAAHIIKRALDRGKRVAFTVPALSLIDQTVAAFEAEGLHEIGVIQGLHPRADPDTQIQIASVQTLARRASPDVDLVLLDEAHLAFKSIFQWMQARAELPFIGLSATPWTRGLGRHYDDLIVAARTGDLIDAGYLSKFIVYAPSAPDLSGVSTVAGDFHEGQLAEACNRAELVGDVIDTWRQRGEDGPTLCYAVDRAHALHLAQRFAEAGIPAEYIDCFTERWERERIFERFRAGEIRVICNVATLIVGIDLDVRCLIDARPTKSEMRFVQTIGRGLRTAEGKDKLVILDHAGNHLRIGMVTDVHHDHLDAGEPKRSEAEREIKPPLPRLCEACSAVMPRKLLRCPSCGTMREAKSDVVATEGELVELGSKGGKSAAPGIMEQATFFAEVKYICSQKGYKPGWAVRQFFERFKHWPNASEVRLAEPQPPSLKTQNWVKSRAIAYAKGRANGSR